MARKQFNSDVAATVDRGGEAAAWARAFGVLIALVLTMLVPLLLPLILVLHGIAERRLVRQRWWWSLTAIAMLLAWFAVWTGPIEWATRALESSAAIWLHLTGTIAATTLRFVGVNEGWLAAAGGVSWPAIITAQLAFTIPVALLLTALWDALLIDQRRQAGKIEGSDYSNVRKPGWLDRARARRSAKRIRTGVLSTVKPGGAGKSAVGVGKYGAAVTVDRRELIKPVLILGRPRMGKTRLAMSLASQQVRAGGAWIIIDYKADGALAAHAAQVAHELGRGFYHFKLADTTGKPYAPPHPYAPPRPATYDPLGSGNGTTKAAMLLDSVPRTGDAAAYKRTAEELVQLGFDIAGLSRLTDVTVDGGQRYSGLEIADRILNLDYLNQLAGALTPAHVHYQYPHMRDDEARRMISDLRARTATLVERVRRDNVVQGAIADTASLLSRLTNSAASAGLLRPSINPGETINLVRAVLRGEIVVFSLNVQAYRDFATLLGNIVILDMQNATQTLRDHKALVAQHTGLSTGGTDATPWYPATLQIEEFGSGDNEVIIGLLNKSSGEGIRVILSTQSWADLVNVDGTGVWAQRVMDQADNMFIFGVNAESSETAAVVFSGTVTKLRSSESIDLRKANIFGLGRAASRASHARREPVDEPRLTPGDVTDLAPGQFYWVRKNAQRTRRGSRSGGTLVTHTVPEGPNQWSEQIAFVGVFEPPRDWNPWTHLPPSDQQQAAADSAAAWREATTDMRSGPIVSRVLALAREDDQARQLDELQHPTTTTAPAAGAGAPPGHGPPALTGTSKPPPAQPSAPLPVGHYPPAPPFEHPQQYPDSRYLDPQYPDPHAGAVAWQHPHLAPTEPPEPTEPTVAGPEPPWQHNAEPHPAWETTPEPEPGPEPGWEPPPDDPYEPPAPAQQHPAPQLAPEPQDGRRRRQPINRAAPPPPPDIAYTRPSPVSSDPRAPLRPRVVQIDETTGRPVTERHIPPPSAPTTKPAPSGADPDEMNPIDLADL